MTWGYRTIFGIERWQSLVVLGFTSVALLALAYVTMVVPEKAYIKIWPNDVFALLNAAYRVYSGQVPSIDFYSHYGPLIYYPFALAWHLGFPPSVVFAFGLVIFAAFMMLATCLITYSRLTLPIALLVLLFLFLQIVVPLPTGRAFDDLTWGTYYNREGWIATALVFLFYVRPEQERAVDRWVDAAVLAGLIVVGFYTKVTYGAVILAAALGLLLLSGYQRRVSLLALAWTVVVLLIVEIISGIHGPYIEDILSVSQAVQNDFWLYFRKVMRNLWVLAACLGVLAIAAAAGRRNPVDWLYAGFCGAASVFLFSKTGGNWTGLPALIAVFAVMGELTRRQEVAALAQGMPFNARRLLGHIGCAVLALVFASEPLANRAVAWQDYHAKITRGGLAPVEGMPPPLAGFLVPRDNTPGYDGLDEAEQRRLEAVSLQLGSRLPIYRYMQTVVDGLELLARTDHEGKAILVLDNADLFTVALGLPPTPQGYPLLFPEDYFTDDNHPPAEAMFFGVDMVLVPFSPNQAASLEAMMRFYGDFLEERFVERDRSQDWRLLVPKPLAEGTQPGG